MVKISYFGQSCFQLDDGHFRLLFDPYVSQNPAQAVRTDELHPDYILVSHGHADHLGDALELSNDNRAPVITTPEVGHYLEDRGCKETITLHIGGKLTLPFGFVKGTQALHSCGIPGGVACGFLVGLDGRIFYFAGDTGLFGDMQLLGAYTDIACAFLPIGDRFTMGPEDAALAAKFLRAGRVIPMHYNGSAKLMQDPQAFERLVEHSTDSKVLVMEPGDTITF